jgi:hypothetical protein
MENQRHKRFLLAPKGDPVQKMDQVVREHEQIIMEDLKKNYLESQKRINHDKLQEMSKA